MKVQFISITNSVLKTLILARQYKDRRQLRLNKNKKTQRKSLKNSPVVKNKQNLKKKHALGPSFEKEEQRDDN